MLITPLLVHVRDLAEFLREYSLDVDVRLTAWCGRENDSYEITVACNPWWRSSAERNVPDVEAVIRCDGVRKAHFDVAGWGWRIDNEEFVIEEDAPEIWACGGQATLFGNSPLADPIRFFISWWDLVHAIGAEQIAELDSTFVLFAQWAERVSRNASYVLLKGPRRLLEQARPLLDEQGVEYQLVGPGRRIEGLRLIGFGSSWLVCENATIEVPDTA